MTCTNPRNLLKLYLLIEYVLTYLVGDGKDNNNHLWLPVDFLGDPV